VEILLFPNFCFYSREFGSLYKKGGWHLLLLLHREGAFWNGKHSSRHGLLASIDLVIANTTMQIKESGREISGVKLEENRECNEKVVEDRNKV